MEYGFDDVGIKLFNSSSSNKFAMLDSKAIIEQLHEFQNFIRHLQFKGNMFTEDYRVLT